MELVLKKGLTFFQGSICLQQFQFRGYLENFGRKSRCPNNIKSNAFIIPLVSVVAEFFLYMPCLSLKDLPYCLWKIFFFFGLFSIQPCLFIDGSLLYMNFQTCVRIQYNREGKRVSWSNVRLNKPYCCEEKIILGISRTVVIPKMQMTSQREKLAD